jgi:hypothetical protein
MCLAAVYSIGVGFVLRLKDTVFSNNASEKQKNPPNIFGGFFSE